MVVLAIDRRISSPMRWCRREPTITEILSDSIVEAVMEADGFDPEVLEAQLRSMAREISAARPASQAGSRNARTARPQCLSSTGRAPRRVGAGRLAPRWANFCQLGCLCYSECNGPHSFTRRRITKNRQSRSYHPKG
jgi:hypothetical protein